MKRSAEAALRRDVTVANWIVERFGLSAAFGHVSARIAGTNTFLLPTRASPALAEANRLLILDTDGAILKGEGTPNTEFWIHARLYAARPEVNAVVHVHPPACTTLTQIGERFRVVHNFGGLFADGLPEFQRVGLIRTRALGDQLARRLGRRRAVMMRGHGATVVDADVRVATVAACFLEEAVDLQLRMLAAAGGRVSRLRTYIRAEAVRAWGEVDATGPMTRAWDYFARRAECDDLHRGKRVERA